ncbi:MAG TPA: PorT family protein [Bacteroidetes bacterium]|nr:PorT family protein [Bacteroidota bacterium]
MKAITQTLKKSSKATRGFIVLLLISPFLCTQSLSAQNIQGGFQLGISASQISGDQLAGFNKAGIYGGFYAFTKIKEQGAFQMEINFVQKGSFDGMNPDKGDYSKYSLNMNYIEIPFLYKYYLSNPKLVLVVGLSYARLIGNAVEKDENGIISRLPSHPKFRNWELGIQGGLEYYFHEKWHAVFRAENSILHVREHSGGATYMLNRGQYHSVLMLSLAYNFSS